MWQLLLALAWVKRLLPKLFQKSLRQLAHIFSTRTPTLPLAFRKLFLKRMTQQQNCCPLVLPPWDPARLLAAILPRFSR